MTTPPDLYALVIRLTAARDGRLRATQGHLAHAAFLDMLRQVDAPLAERLHSGGGRKPFTVSALEGFGRARDSRLSVAAGQEGWLRVTLLDPRLFATFIGFFLRGNPRVALRLEQTEFQVSEVLNTSGRHPLAGYDSLAGLHDRWEATTLTAAHRLIALDFRSPTAFSLRGGPGTGRRMHVLPDPPLVFGELAGYWDGLTGDDTQAAVRDFAAHDVVVSRYQLATHMGDYGGGRLQIGFAGRAAFEILNPSRPDLTRHLNRLADLAFFTGLGSKTTMGMGQVRRIGREEWLGGDQA
jgi:CRISPR-associated endoribonuclease Cas6